VSKNSKLRKTINEPIQFHNVSMSVQRFVKLQATARIRIVADCVALPCQVTRKLKRAITLEFTAVSAIIFIHCYQPYFYSFNPNPTNKL